MDEQFLLENGINFEVVEQQPGYALYAPGYAWHQVRNSGHGMNIAWNIAPTSLLAIDEMMTAYIKEVYELKKTPMVPVPRVIHGLYFSHRHMFEQSCLSQFVEFLLREATRDKRNYDTAQKKRDTHNRCMEVRLAETFAFNNCQNCCHFFYLSAFAWTDQDFEVEYCWKCIAKVSKATCVYRKTIFDSASLISYLIGRQRGVPEGSHEDANKETWRYPHEAKKALKWIPDQRQHETLL